MDYIRVGITRSETSVPVPEFLSKYDGFRPSGRCSADRPIGYRIALHLHEKPSRNGKKSVRAPAEQALDRPTARFLLFLARHDLRLARRRDLLDFCHESYNEPKRRRDIVSRVSRNPPGSSERDGASEERRFTTVVLADRRLQQPLLSRHFVMQGSSEG